MPLRFRTWIESLETHTLDPDFVGRMRKDFLLLMSNVNRVQTPGQLREFSEGLAHFRNWVESIYTRIDKPSESPLMAAVQQVVGDDAKQYLPYWDQKIRTVGWKLTIELNLPMHDVTADPQAQIARFLREKDRWAARVKRNAAPFWKELNDLIFWISQRNQTRATIVRPGRSAATIAGHRVILFGYDPANKRHDAYLKNLAHAIGQYKRRVREALPSLAKFDIPIEADFVCDFGEKGGEYYADRKYISLCQWTDNPSEMVQVIAHEMAHHWYKGLSKDAQDYWRAAVAQDTHALDLRKIHEDWPEEYQYTWDWADAVKRTDPDLSIYLDLVSWNKGVAGFNGPTFNTKEELGRVIAAGDTAMAVHRHPISSYAHKNAEEAFCEAVGHLVASGPRRLHPLTLRWLRTAVGMA